MRLPPLRLPTLVLPALLLLGATACAPTSTTEPTPAPLALRVMSVNVGNGDDGEPGYPLRLSYQAYEEHVAARIASFEPDLVALQEVLPRHTCAAFEETDPARTCFDYENREDAALRLLPAGWSVVCDARLQVECVGVAPEIGTIAGLEAGGYGPTAAETPALPLPSCSYADGACTEDLCDAESTVSGLTVDLAEGGTLRVAHAHPNASGFGDAGFYYGNRCRALQLTQLFEGLDGAPALVDEGGWNLALGDFNLDPEGELAQEDELAVWEAHVGEGGFTFHAARDPETGETWPTTNFPVTIDHVLTTGATGSCVVLGESPDTERIDAGFDWSQLPDGASFDGRIDHRALLCDLVFASAE